MSVAPVLDPGPPAGTSSIRGAAVRPGDKIFRSLSSAAGALVLLIMAAIGAFLIWKAIPALQANTASFFTTQAWTPDANPSVFGIAALAFGTLISSIIAMVVAVPVGFGIALFTSHYAHRRVSALLGGIVDLLAAVPSIIFGLWGLQFLMPHTIDLWAWLNDHLGFIPLFKNTQGLYTRSIALASLVLAIMILPTVSAISREVFNQVPRAHIEAALALGATRWEMVRTAIIPFGRPGMISAAMLGLGRALGETIAVALVLSPTYIINRHITEPGGITFASNIALKWGEAGPIGLGALIASGLVLFVITLLVNIVARIVIERRRDFAGAN
ncbi:MAG TPA: phosphate ABC transporter permease subunit PstC [Dermatophilaceae bacterium]